MLEVDNPYFSISSDRGEFQLDEIPPGRYAVTAWHPTLGRQSTAVTIAANQVVEVTFEFR